MKTRRSLFAPEVVQTSAMDCGPAALKCLLEGYGSHVSYGRLREACQTDVDGTSIDTLEEVAVQLGLAARQIMAPADHVLLPSHELLPAIAVVVLPSGLTHFVVLWRQHGRWVQVMDPATGRRWAARREVLNDLYRHQMAVPAVGWLEWAGSDDFLGPLEKRLRGLLPARDARRMIGHARDAGGWKPLGALDAATRMMASMRRSGGLPAGRSTARLLERILDSGEDTDAATGLIPENYWSARQAPPGPDGEEQLLMRGAVLVRVDGAAQTREEVWPADGEQREPEPPRLSPELQKALDETPVKPGLELLRLLRADGFLTPATTLLSLALAAGGTFLELLLFRGLIDLPRELGLSGQRIGAIAVIVLLGFALLLLEVPIVASALRMGRRLETRLRVAFLEKIPQLGDRYFHSRLTSDMAERCHSVHRIRQLPEAAVHLLRSVFEILLTTAGLVWLYPEGAWLACGAAIAALLVPLVSQPAMAERDLRLRSHVGALSRFYLDALLGLIPIRVHGSARAVRREHETLLSEWTKSALRLQRLVIGVEALQMIVGFGLAGWLLFDHLAANPESANIILLVYWALNLPVLGQEVAAIARQYPALRNTVLRLLEPLGAESETEDASDQPEIPDLQATPGRGVSLSFENVSAQSGGHPILADINLRIEPGTHVALVGPSGAGKSSLAGLLLGWLRPARGRLLVDGEPLSGGRLERLRRECAWVDPAVQLWNRSFLDNLHYGAPSGRAPDVQAALDDADLRGVLERLPDGLQTMLGEGGALVSGGEGQRVRLGRAILRPGARLVILDEPFRGLDRETRRRLLAKARQRWRDATLICITHDVGDARGFDRVLVMAAGRLVEVGAPEELCGRPDSRFGDLVRAEEAAHKDLWAAASWRRLRLESGELREEGVGCP